MKKNIFTLLSCGVLLCSTILTSCSSDYLDTKPTDSTGAIDAIASTENAKKALNGISKLMTTQHYYFGQGFAGENNIMAHYENYPSQNYLYNYYAPGWAPIHNQEFHNRTNSIYDAYAWYYYYSIIGAANTIICNIDKAEGIETEKQFIKASALTFRAYAFEKLTHYYCWRWEDSKNGSSQGLVLRLDESTDDMPYSTLADTYTRIYTDLDEAIKLFEKSGVDRPQGEVWTPNINVAHAVYARAALNKQDYATAITHAKVAQNGYPLMSNEEYKAGFCNPTIEWIFGSFGGSQENVWYWSYGTQFSCNGYYASKQPTGAGAIGIDLINKIPNNDTRKALFLTVDKFPELDYNKENTIEKTYGIWGGINDEGKIIDEEVAKVVKAYCNSMTVNGLTPPYESGFMHLGGQLKFHVFDLPGVSYLPFIRSSEMVLIEAEANFRLDKETEAIAALIKLNKDSKRNESYSCTKTGDDLWNEIMDYRELELWGEGFAWSDYKRWNRDIVRKSFKDGGNAHISIAIKIPANGANKWTWDVPLNETDYNNDLK